MGEALVENEMDDTEYKNRLLDEIRAVQEVNDKLQDWMNKHLAAISNGRGLTGKEAEDLSRLLFELDFILNGA